MKNNYFLVILILLVLSSCSKNRAHISTHEFKNYEKKLGSLLIDRSSKRDIANQGADVCLEDELSTNRLLNEIRDLEFKTPMEANRSSAILRGLNLKQFSSMQAAFLEKNIDWINTEVGALSHCQDVSCIYKNIYPNSDGWEGFLIYYFYLKTGVIVSTVKEIPNLNLNNFADRDILFSKAELNSFFHLAQSLGPSFYKMKSLKSIHRMPPNRSLVNFPTACGLAGASLDKGYILLLDGCLIKNSLENYNLNLLSKATHEFAHQLDYVLQGNTSDYKRFSEMSPIWLSFSGWYLKEAINPGTGAVISRQWDRKTGPLRYDGFVRDYAATSPVEDFADTVAYSRFEPKVAYEKSPLKYEWITANIFNNKKYLPLSLGGTYSSYLKNEAFNSLSEVINKCIKNKNSFIGRNEKNKNQFNEYDKELIACVLGGLEQSISIGIRWLKANELEACGYFKLNTLAVKDNVFSDLEILVKNNLNINIEIATQLKTLSELTSSLEEEIDPREIFTWCLEDNDPSVCYSNKLELTFEALANEYRTKIPNQVTTLKTNFLGQNHYSKIKEEIRKFFDMIFLGSEVRFSKEAKRKWQVCFSEKEFLKPEFEREEVLLTPFNAGTQFVNKQLLNCLNFKAEDELFSVLNKASSKLGISISNPYTQKFVLNMYLNHYTSVLQGAVLEEAKKEALEVNKVNDLMIKNISNNLINNLSWIKEDVVVLSDAKSLCLAEVKTNFESEFKTYLNNNKIYFNFHPITKRELAENILLCKKVLDAYPVLSLIEKNQINKVNNSLPSLKTIVLENANMVAKDCKKKFSKPDKTSVKSSRLCLTNQKTWSGIIDTAISAWLKLDKMDEISFSKKTGLDYLIKSKDEIQNEVILKMDAIVIPVSK